MLKHLDLLAQCEEDRGFQINIHIMTTSEKFDKLTEDQKEELLKILNDHRNLGSTIIYNLNHLYPEFFPVIPKEIKDMFKKHQALIKRLDKLQETTGVGLVVYG